MSTRHDPGPVLALLLATTLLACDVGQVTFNDSGGSLLETGTLVVAPQIPLEDSSLASELGWRDGVPRARVMLLREGRIGVVPIGDTITALTDSSGYVTFDALEPGDTYRVSASRRLTAEQRDSIRDQHPAAFAVGGGTKSTPVGTLRVAVAPNVREGLVFSEFAGVEKLEGEGVSYDFGGFIEPYNNSDRTVYLDGRVIGAAYAFDLNFPVFPCAETMPFQNDSTGIWTRFFQAFPGSGSEHPLRPGETVVVATDAIDHRKVAPEYLDLRDADFEFWGGAGDVDNPDVPNMMQVGLAPDQLGHGLGSNHLSGVPEAAFLADQVTVESLRRGRPVPGDQTEYVFVPATKILDVFTGVWGGWDDRDERFCDEVLNDRFDRLAMIWDHPNEPVFWSAQRSVAGTVGGQPVLLDTNTSEVDFRLTRPRTPGALPRP